MENIPTLFNKSIDELRRIGARGGRAHGRNCRARRLAAMPAEPVLVVLPVRPEEETTAQAIATLDGNFPWLRGAETNDVICASAEQKMGKAKLAAPDSTDALSIGYVSYNRAH